MKVAVTGATGFLGRHVVAALLQTGVEVVAAARSVDKLADLADRIELVSLDIGNAGPAPYARLGRPDVVVHLAWEGLPNYRSLHHVASEMPRQYAFLSDLCHAGLGNLVVAGTCFEYGMQSGALAEDFACQPANPYALAKFALLRQLQFLQREVAFNLSWARLFYTFGSGQAASSLFTQFNLALGRNDGHFDMSGGEQLRDFLPVAELASMLTQLALLRSDAGVVNVCSGQPRSVRNLVEGWVAQAGRSITLNLGVYPYPDYEPMAFWGNPSKFRSILGAQ